MTSSPRQESLYLTLLKSKCAWARGTIKKSFELIRKHNLWSRGRGLGDGTLAPFRTTSGLRGLSSPHWKTQLKPAWLQAEIRLQSAGQRLWSLPRTLLSAPLRSHSCPSTFWEQKGTLQGTERPSLLLSRRPRSRWVSLPSPPSPKEKNTVNRSLSFSLVNIYFIQAQLRMKSSNGLSHPAGKTLKIGLSDTNRSLWEFQEAPGHGMQPSVLPLG